MCFLLSILSQQLKVCEGHWGHSVCACVSVSLNMSLCSREVAAVAKGMPWLQGASQPAEGVSLEVALPPSFICGDRLC